MNYVINSASSQLTPDEIEFIFRIDQEDYPNIEKVQEWVNQVVSAIPEAFRHNIKVIVGPKLFGYCSNTDFFEEMHEKAEGEFYFFLNDDIHGISTGWDNEIRKYRGKVCILKTANPFDNLDFPVVAAKWREVNGTFGYAPFLPYDMHSWDNYFPEMFVMSNIRVDHTAIAEVGNNSNAGMACGAITHPDYLRSKHLQEDGTWAPESLDFGTREGEINAAADTAALETLYTRNESSVRPLGDLPTLE